MQIEITVRYHYAEVKCMYCYIQKLKWQKLKRLCVQNDGEYVEGLELLYTTESLNNLIPLGMTSAVS